MENDDFKLAEYEIKELLYNDFFQDDVKALRLKYDIPLEGFSKDLDRRNWLDSNPKDKSYKADVSLLMSNYSLGYKWKHGLFLYIELGNEKYLRVQNTWGLSYSHVGDSFSPKNLSDLKIEVDPSITQEELKKAHEALRRLVSKAGMKTKRQYVENIDRDYEVHKMHKAGKSVKEICFWLNENRSGSFNDDSVKKIISRASDRFGKRHPWSE